MLEGKEGGGGIPDEMAIAILFSCHHDQDHLNAVPLISRPQRHRVVEKAVSQVIAQFDGELAIPWVRGKFSSSGATVIYLEKPDFTPHTKLYDPNTIAVLDVHTEATEDGGLACAGFDAYVRLGETNTWLCIGIRPPEDGDEDGMLVYTENDEQAGAPDLSPENLEVLTNIAARVAVARGFSAVVLRVEPREKFAARIVQEHMKEFVDLGPFITEDRIVEWASYLARDYWEFYVTPMRAASLKTEGKSPPQIAKELGITKRRAERALELSLTLDDGINSPHLVPLILKHAPDIRR